MERENVRRNDYKDLFHQTFITTYILVYICFFLFFASEWLSISKTIWSYYEEIGEVLTQQMLVTKFFHFAVADIFVVKYKVICWGLGEDKISSWLKFSIASFIYVMEINLGSNTLQLYWTRAMSHQEIRAYGNGTRIGMALASGYIHYISLCGLSF